MSGNQKVLGIVSIVCGAVGICFAWTMWVNIAAMIAAIAGIVLAVMSKKGFAAAGESSPIPTVGLVLSIIGVVVSVIGFFTCTVCACAASKALQDPSVQSSLANALSSALAQ